MLDANILRFITKLSWTC